MNKMNKKKVIPMLLSLVLTSSLAACSGVAQTQPASAAGTAVTSNLTASNISASGAGQVSISDAVASAVQSKAVCSKTGNTVSAAPKASTTPAASQSAGNNAVTANNAKVEAVNTGSTSSCPNAAPSTSAGTTKTYIISPSTASSCKNSARYIISGNSISCIPNFCGTNVCAVIQCNSSTCKNTSCKSSTCKTTASSAPSASSKPSSGTPSASSKPSTSSSAPAQANGTMASQVLQIVNAERAKNGLGALKLNTNVAKAAQVRATEIVTQFSHTRPNGQDPFTALKEAGVSYSAAGENIAYGQPDAQSVMTAWMNSPGHRANILNSRFTQIGIGVYKDSKGVYYWTQEFIG